MWATRGPALWGPLPVSRAAAVDSVGVRCFSGMLVMPRRSWPCARSHPAQLSWQAVMPPLCTSSCTGAEAGHESGLQPLCTLSCTGCECSWCPLHFGRQIDGGLHCAPCARRPWQIRPSGSCSPLPAWWRWPWPWWLRLLCSWATSSARSLPRSSSAAHPLLWHLPSLSSGSFLSLFWEVSLGTLT